MGRERRCGDHSGRNPSRCRRSWSPTSPTEPVVESEIVLILQAVVLMEKSTDGGTDEGVAGNRNRYFVGHVYTLKSG